MIERNDMSKNGKYAMNSDEVNNKKRLRSNVNDTTPVSNSRSRPLRVPELPKGYYNEDSEDSSLGDHVQGNGCMHILALTHQFGGFNNGVKTLQTLDKNTFLGEYTGDILNHEEMLKRQRERPLHLQYIVILEP